MIGVDRFAPKFVCTSKRLFVVLIVNVFCSTAAFSQNPSVICQSGGKSPACNGISVGMPKVFDNRSLTLQIEALQKALQQQQATNSTIDLKSVMAALANTQGLTQSEVSTVLSILGNPTPSTSLTTDLKTGNVDSNGNPLPNTTDTQTSKNVASVTPAAPSFDSFAALPSGFNPAFGPSASDLLSDQINLNYHGVVFAAGAGYLFNIWRAPFDLNLRYETVVDHGGSNNFISLGISRFITFGKRNTQDY